MLVLVLSPLTRAATASAQLADPTPVMEAPVDPDALLVRVTSDHPITLHDGGSNERLCQSPCELTLQPGTHRFGVSLGERSVQLAEPIELARSGTLYARYVSHEGLRAAGWSVFSVGVAAAVGLGIAGGLMAASGDMLGAPAGIGLLFVAAFNLVLGLALGLPLIFAGDGAEVRFE